jgi:hypothetical protein
MQFIRQSTKNLQFEVPEEILHKSADVMIYDGTAYFKRHKFYKPELCEKWYAENIEGGIMNINPEFVMRKELYNIKSVSGEPSNKEWKTIQALMLAPDEFTKEDVAVYHPILANNIVDRQNERFSINVLKGFARTLPDKSLMMGHEGSDSFQGPGVGRFFEASVEEKTFDEALEIIGPQPNQKRIQKIIKTIIEEDGGLYFLRTGFYILRDNFYLIRQMQAGIVKDMSIGFCRITEKRAVLDKDKRLDYWVLEGDGEAVEGSFVGVPAQPGMKNVKNLDLENIVPVPTVPEKSESVKTEEIKLKEVKRMKLESKSLGLTLESENETDISNQVETKASALVSQVEKLGNEVKTLNAEKQTAVDTIKTLETEVGTGNLTAEHLKAVEANAKAYKDFLVGECIRIGNMIKVFKPEEAETKRIEFEALDIPALKSKQGEYQAIFDQSETVPTQLKTDKKDGTHKDPSYRHIPADHFSFLE